MKKAGLFILLLLLIACSRRELPQSPEYGEPVLYLKRAPEILSPKQEYRVEIVVESGNPVDSVNLSVYKDASLIETHYLFDDGAALHPDDGDVAAFDGVFTQTIRYTAASSRDQELLWRFTASDKSQPLELTLTALANPNSPPKITHIELPDELPSGFSGTRSIRVSVADSNGVNDVTQVSYEAFLDNNKVFENKIDSALSPGMFEKQLTAEYAAGKKSGDYQFVFQAWDASGAASDKITRTMSIYNDAPGLEQPVHVDSVMRPVEGRMTAFLITIRVTDDQGIDDIKRVWMKWRKADGSYPIAGPYFDLYDNGLAWNEDFSGWDQGARGDEIADDGVYSITGTFDFDEPLGDYTFTFYAMDFAGNSSDSTTSHLMLYTEEN